MRKGKPKMTINSNQPKSDHENQIKPDRTYEVGENLANTIV